MVIREEAGKGEEAAATILYSIKEEGFEVRGTGGEKGREDMRMRSRMTMRTRLMRNGCQFCSRQNQVLKSRFMSAMTTLALASSTTRGEHVDTLVHAVDGKNEVRVCVMTASSLVKSAVKRHEMAPTAAAALGRALMGTVMMATGREKGESLQTFFRGNGILGNILCIADSEGNVKGRVGNPTAHIEARADGKLDVGKVVGEGTLSVSRTLPWSDEPYTGTVDLHNGEIAEDFAHYLSQSEQINSAIGLGVSLVNNEDLVDLAGGFFVQVMPECSEDTLARLETNVEALPPPTQLMSEGKSAENIVDIVLDGMDGKIIDTFNPTYGPCDSSDLRLRMLRTLTLLGQGEIDKMLEEMGQIEMKCEFCGDVIQFGKTEVEQYISSLNDSRIT